MINIKLNESLKEFHGMELLSLIFEMVVSLVLTLLENNELLSLSIDVCLLAEFQFQWQILKILPLFLDILINLLLQNIGLKLGQLE